MKFPPSILEDIKARLPVSAVVGRRVQLKKAGREWKGLSPFGKERTPSFFVNDQKQAWFDFSSGRNGDIFKFVMETEGLSFPEAVERLAAEAGVTLPRMSADAFRQEEARKGLHEAIELAARFFEAELRGPRGAEARRYLAGRGLAGEVARQFRLGYAPADRFALRDHLAGEGVSAEIMAEAGLLIHGEDIAVPYDRFRDRVMFPIADAKGRIVAFGGRAMNPDAPAKYLNTAETGLFHKGRLLYNQHNARKAAHDSGRVIAVEGYVDVIAMTMAGFPETVAPLGTALTEEQLALLWRMAPEPVLCFDGDKAGRKAAYRAIDVALPLIEAGRSLRFALLPEGQDPDDLVRAGGADAVRSVVEQARPLVDLIWSREVEAAPLETPEQKAAFERRLAAALGVIKDEDLRRHYRDEMETRLQALFPRGRGQFRGRASSGGQRRSGEARFGAGLSGPPTPMRASASLARSALFAAPGRGESPREAMILLAIVQHPTLLQAHADELAEIEWQGRSALVLCQALLQSLVDGEAGADSLPLILAGTSVAQARAALQSALRPGDRLAIGPEAEPHAVGEMIHQALVLHRRARTLHNELKAAEHALASDPSEGNLAWLLDVQSRLSSLDGVEANES